MFEFLNSDACRLNSKLKRTVLFDSDPAIDVSYSSAALPSKYEDGGLLIPAIRQIQGVTETVDVLVQSWKRATILRTMKMRNYLIKPFEWILDECR